MTGTPPPPPSPSHPPPPPPPPPPNGCKSTNHLDFHGSATPLMAHLSESVVLKYPPEYLTSTESPLAMRYKKKFNSLYHFPLFPLQCGPPNSIAPLFTFPPPPPSPPSPVLWTPNSIASLFTFLSSLLGLPTPLFSYLPFSLLCPFLLVASPNSNPSYFLPYALILPPNTSIDL